MASISIVEYPFEVRVLVATWPDGVSLWRKISRTAGKVFCFQGPHGEGSFGIHGHHVGIFSTQHRFFDPLVDHGRWVLQALGVKERISSPVWGTAKKEDPLVARLTLPWREALERAKLLDHEVDQIYAAAGIDEKNRFRWKRLQEQDGSNDAFERACMASPESHDLVTRVRTFLAELLEKAWIEPGFDHYRRTGDLRPSVWTPPEGHDQQKNLGEDPDTLRWYRVRDFGAYRPKTGWTLTDLISALKMQPTGLVVRPEPELSRWLESHEVKGELTVPDDELEIYRMLGEKLPFLWPDEEFLAWAEERAPP